MFIRQKFFILLCLLLILINKVYSDSGSAGQAARYLRMGVGARALGMGGAHVAVANDATAAYWNPAGLANLKSKEISLMYSKLSLDRGYNFINYVHPLNNDKCVGISWINFSVRELEEWIKEGDVHKYIGKFKDLENALMLSYAYKTSFVLFTILNVELSIGANLKYLDQRFVGLQRIKDYVNYEPKAYGISTDLGLLLGNINENTYSIGIVLQDIGGVLKWDSGRKDRLPLVIKIGNAWSLLNNKLIIAADIEKVTRNIGTKLHLGAEYKIIKNFKIRAGVNDSHPSLGIGVVLPISNFIVSLDYAFGWDTFTSWKENISNLERYTHRMAVSFAF